MGKMNSEIPVSMIFRASFVGHVSDMIEPLRRFGFLPADEPRKIQIDYKEVVTGVPVTEALKRVRRSLKTDYPGNSEIFDVDLSVDMIQAGVPEARIAMKELARQLAEVPFEVAAFASMYYGHAWGAVQDDDSYSPPGFSDGHVKLGWAAAFRGRGHDRLVSRNWLRGGPFKFWQGPGDVSLVQFYALDADAATALEQAKPGHREIGITDDTGFLQRNFVYELDLSGLYEAETRTMKVVVLGRDIPNLELLEWAAVKKFQPQGPDQIVDVVAYVFPVEAEARANLHRLWRYGHQCWAIRDGREIRLDLDYQPPDTTPAWAR